MAERKETKIVFDSPLREGNDYYLATLMKSQMYINEVLSDTTFNFSDVRIPLIVESLIQMIIADKNRAKIYERINTERLKLMDALTEKEKKELSATDLARINILAHLRSVGMVTDFVGVHKGLTHENRLSVVVSRPDIILNDTSDLEAPEGEETDEGADEPISK